MQIPEDAADIKQRDEDRELRMRFRVCITSDTFSPPTLDILL